MARFVSDIGRKYYNLDRVREARVSSSNPKEIVLYDENGELGKIPIDFFEEACGPFVPATPYNWYLRIDVCPEDGERPVESDVFIKREPIIAWHVSSSGIPTPITMSGERPDPILLELPNGEVWAYDVTENYKNAAAAAEAALLCAQREFDHIKKPT